MLYKLRCSGLELLGSSLCAFEHNPLIGVNLNLVGQLMGLIHFCSRSTEFQNVHYKFHRNSNQNALRFSFKETHLQMPFAKMAAICLGLGVLRACVITGVATEHNH